jgi:hypothetical protein
LDRTFGHGASCCFPQFFSKEEIKRTKERKMKKKESSDVWMLSIG